MSGQSITVGTLCSGSSGNCALIRVGPTAILIDAGRSTRYLRGALESCGITPGEIDAIFVTHPHCDHTQALRVWTKTYRTPVHATGVTAFEIADACAEGTLVRHPETFETDVGILRVSSFVTSHDTASSVGYRVTVREGLYAGVSFGLATDLGCVTDGVLRGMRGCRAAIVESNHDVDMLLGGPYTPEMKRRILSRNGHLSNPDSSALSVRLAAAGTDALLLAHLSEINNTPELAYSCTKAALDRAGLSPYLYVGARDRPVLMVDVR